MDSKRQEFERGEQMRTKEENLAKGRKWDFELKREQVVTHKSPVLPKLE